MGMNGRRAALAASVAAAAMLTAGAAAAADEASVAVEEVVVTAQKREQALIDVPQSISVVSGATLETLQATTFSDYVKLVPGLQVVQSNPGNARLALRPLARGAGAVL